MKYCPFLYSEYTLKLDKASLTYDIVIRNMGKLQIERINQDFDDFFLFANTLDQKILNLL